MSETRNYDTGASNTSITRIRIRFENDRAVNVELNPGTTYWGAYSTVVAEGSKGTMISAQHYGGEGTGEVFSAFLSPDYKYIHSSFVNWNSSGVIDTRAANGPMEE